MYFRQCLEKVRQFQQQHNEAIQIIIIKRVYANKPTEKDTTANKVKKSQVHYGTKTVQFCL